MHPQFDHPSQLGSLMCYPLKHQAKEIIAEETGWLYEGQEDC